MATFTSSPMHNFTKECQKRNMWFYGNSGGCFLNRCNTHVHVMFHLTQQEEILGTVVCVCL
jgi:hypothetical protein